MIEFTIEFVTLKAKHIIKTIKARNYDDACYMLEKKYDIAYFVDYIEGNKEDYINKFYFEH